MRFSPQCAEEVKSRTHDCHKSPVAVQILVHRYPLFDVPVVIFVDRYTCAFLLSARKEVKSRTHDCHKSPVADQSTGLLVPALVAPVVISPTGTRTLFSMGANTGEFLAG